MRNGIIAILIPNNFHSHAHQTALNILQSQKKWNSLADNLRYGLLDKPLYDPYFYYDLLIKSGLKKAKVWQTEYFQEMDSHQKIFDWISGTGLRPVLTSMDEESQKEFEKLYVNALQSKYPTRSNSKVLLPYLRMLMVGER